MNSTLFHLTDHHAFVSRHGSVIQWKKAYLCPCSVEADAARAQPTCFLCGGIGTTYAAAENMIALVTGISREFALLEAGIAESGDLVLSPSPLEHRILSQGDAFVLSSFPGQSFQGELIKRNRATRIDMLSYTPTKVTRCFTADQSLETVREFTSSTNFVIAGRTLTWSADPTKRPLADAVYSISYSAQIEWVLVAGPMDRRDSQNLGPRCILRPRHIVQAKS